MNHARRLRLAFCVAITAAVVGCLFIDNPGPDESGAGGADAGSDVGGDAADAGPSLCDARGGYKWAQKVAADTVQNLANDCQINAFFAGLPPDAALHFQDCLTKQIAVLTRCKDIKYDVDSNGKDCRDMKTAHHGMALRSGDMDAFVQHM